MVFAPVAVAVLEFIVRAPPVGATGVSSVRHVTSNLLMIDHWPIPLGRTRPTHIPILRNLPLDATCAPQRVSRHAIGGWLVLRHREPTALHSTDVDRQARECGREIVYVLAW